MFQIAICDDIPDQVQQIKAAAERYLKAHNRGYAKITYFDNPLLFLDYIDQNGGFDIVLLDICMSGISGTEIASEIRRRKDRTEIVFLTTSDEFAVADFTMKAAHYLLKPFYQAQFDEAIDKATEAFNSGEPAKLLLKLLGGGTKLVEINEIVCIESYMHDQIVELETGEIIDTKESLSSFFTQLEELAQGQFMMPYKGYIVNRKAIRSVEPDGMKLLGGKCVPIVRRSFRKLSEQYLNYTFGGGRR